MQEKAKFDILSLNVRGIRDQAKRRSIFLYLKGHNSKIISYEKLTLNQKMKLFGKTNGEVKYFSLTEPSIVKVFAFFYTLRYKIRSITHSVTRLEELC